MIKNNKCKGCKKILKSNDPRSKFCSKLCFYHHINPLLGNEKQIIKLYKNGLSTIKIGKIFNCHASTCERLLKKYGIVLRKKKYTLNDDYFHIIDSPEKAYWLGMIATDGNVARNVNVVSLSLIDREHIEKFKLATQATYNIYNNSKKDFFTLQITSKQIKNDLKKYGIIPNKSKILKPPKLKNYEVDFWRGCLDGDGGISKRNKYWRIFFCGTPDMVLGFLNFIEKNTGIRHREYRINDFFSKIQFDKFSEIKRIVMLLYYNNCPVSLDRKHKLTEDIINNITNINER